MKLIKSIGALFCVGMMICSTACNNERAMSDSGMPTGTPNEAEVFSPYGVTIVRADGTTVYDMSAPVKTANGSLSYVPTDYEGIVEMFSNAVEKAETICKEYDALVLPGMFIYSRKLQSDVETLKGTEIDVIKKSDVEITLNMESTAAERAVAEYENYLLQVSQVQVVATAIVMQQIGEARRYCWGDIYGWQYNTNINDYDEIWFLGVETEKEATEILTDKLDDNVLQSIDEDLKYPRIYVDRSSDIKYYYIDADGERLIDVTVSEKMSAELIRLKTIMESTLEAEKGEVQ